MFSSIRSRLTYANVVSTLCLFILLGGTSYALATGSIDSREIKDNTIRSKDIRNNEVSSSDVRNSSLLARDFKAGQLPQGPRGNTGPTGHTGPRGPAGLSGVEVVTATVPENSTDFKNINADCPAGKKAISTAAELTPAGAPPQVALQAVSFGLGRLSAYGAAREISATGANWGLLVQAVCAHE